MPFKFYRETLSTHISKRVPFLEAKFDEIIAFCVSFNKSYYLPKDEL